MSNATINQYGEMGIRLVTLHNSHQMSSWPCSVLVGHFIYTYRQTSTKKNLISWFKYFSFATSWLQWTGAAQCNGLQTGVQSVSRQSQDPGPSWYQFISVVREGESGGTISWLLRWLLKCSADTAHHNWGEEDEPWYENVKIYYCRITVVER